RVNQREKLEELVDVRTAELADAMKKAREADRLKSAFLATMSHELRTPLNSIIGFTGILAQKLAGPLNDEQIKQLGMVSSSARHLLELINDVLDISKIEAGQATVIFEKFNLPASIEKIVKTVLPLAEKKNLKINVAININPETIESDQRRVEQILLNLLNNAIKFTEKGSVSVKCEEAGEKIIISVVDTGIGIKDEDMGKLFNAFQQIDSGITRRYEGTGLGLSICKKLGELLGGEITVTSTWGKGSTFSFVLPRQKTPPGSAQ
ncbi:MAG TPA: ATP-binding protein, partial [Smithellaceae bacterium]|nr:ATP-binding protein [Smithellaceae bacterium]